MYKFAPRQTLWIYDDAVAPSAEPSKKRFMGVVEPIIISFFPGRKRRDFKSIAIEAFFPPPLGDVFYYLMTGEILMKRAPWEAPRVPLHRAYFH